MLTSTPSLNTSTGTGTGTGTPKRPSSPSRYNHHSPSHSVSSVRGYHSPKRSSVSSKQASAAISALKVDKVIGTTATSHANFSLAGDLLAYTAGAGVVVYNIVTKQSRFFCTSTKQVQSIQQSIASASSLPAWLAEYAQNLPSPIRDSNGYLVGGINNDSIQSTSLGINNEELSSLANAKSTPAKDKMKTASCVALSFDGTLLAVGETGHQPRVFIYSTASDSSSNVPVAILCEHRYGIKLLAFSPCGNYLATLGNTSDGFLHIWKLNLKDTGVSLHSSNRCISMVHDMKWMGSDIVITVGVRHVRAWKIDSGKTQWADTKANVLSGRNLVLGEFSNSIFSCVLAISENVAIVATEKGDLATVEDNDEKPTFTPRLNTGEEISCMDIDEDKNIWVAGPGLRSIALERIVGTTEKCSVAVSIPRKRCTIRAIGCRGESGSIIRLTAEREISIDENTLIASSHANELKGIRKIVGTDKFLTWSTDGVVRVWSNTGECEHKYNVEFSDEDTELSIAFLSEDGKLLIVGDRNGIVQILGQEGEEVCQSFVAHGSSVVGIDYYKSEEKDLEMFITCSRDRTVQVFKKSNNQWELHQTLMAHKGNIHAAYLTADGQRIVSSSVDRTIAIHKFVQNEEGAVFVSEKVISLKTTPLDMCLDPTSTRIIVSADKHIMIYKISGELASTYRCTDGDYNSDSVSLGTITIGTFNDCTYLAGVGQDKGIRVYDHSTGLYLGTDWGHSEGVSGVAWLNSADSSGNIVSSGYDGCIFLWKVQDSGGAAFGAAPISQAAQLLPQSSPQPQSPVTPARPPSPTRKILSKQELSKFLPSPSPKTPQQQVVSSASPSGARKSTVVQTSKSAQLLSRRKSLQPSKSMSELKPRKHQSSCEMTSIEESEPILPSTPSTPSAGSSSRTVGTAPLRRGDPEEITFSLIKFREQYKKQPKWDQNKVERLKTELKQTLRLLDGKTTERARMDDLLEQFGERLVSVVEDRLAKSS